MARDGPNWGLLTKKRDKKDYSKRTPQEEISGLIAQVQYQYLDSTKEGHFRQMCGLYSADGYMLQGWLGAQACNNLGQE